MGDSQKGHSSMAQTFPKFLELPAELRLKIYFHILVADSPILPTEVQPLSILRASCRVYKEASDEPYYQHNTFILGESGRDEKQWLTRIGAKRRQMIRKVEFQDGPNKYISRKMFTLLGQCSKLNLTMETPMAPLVRSFHDGNMDYFLGVAKVTIEHLCESREKESTQALWGAWLEELEEVKAHLESIHPPACHFHANKDRLGPQSAVHLRITHCCRQEHCCDSDED